MKKKIFMACTKDKYELPIAVEDSCKVLAEKIGMKPESLRSCICHKTRGYHRLIIDVDEDD